MREESQNEAEGSARHRALALFLRARRKGVSPEEAGLMPRTRRRNGGLSREEVAYLAGISADWYGRLEAGLAVVPSAATLLAVARALRMSAVETEYLFELAGSIAPRPREHSGAPVAEALPKLILAPERVGLVLWDAYVTPLAWNAIGDAMFKFSSYPTALERNSIVRMTDPYLVAYFGADYQSVVRQVVGIFRRAYTAHTTTFAQQIYERAKAYPDFQKYWDEYVVADEATLAEGPHVRHHPTVGSFSVVVSDLFMLRRQDMFMRVIAPADDHAADTFLALKQLGTASQ